MLPFEILRPLSSAGLRSFTSFRNCCILLTLASFVADALLPDRREILKLMFHVSASRTTLIGAQSELDVEGEDAIPVAVEVDDGDVDPRLEQISHKRCSAAVGSVTLSLSPLFI